MPNKLDDICNEIHKLTVKVGELIEIEKGKTEAIRQANDEQCMLKGNDTMGDHSNIIPGTYNEVSTHGGNIAFIHRIIDGEPLLSIDKTDKVVVDADRWTYELEQSSVMALFQFFDWLLSEEAVSSMYVKENGKWCLTNPEWVDSPPMNKQIDDKINALYWPSINKEGNPEYIITLCMFPAGVYHHFNLWCTIHELSILSMMLLLFISNCPMYYSSIHNNISKKIGDWVASGSKDTFQTYIHNHQQRATDFLRHSSDPC